MGRGSVGVRVRVRECEAGDREAEGETGRVRGQRRERVERGERG